MGYISYEVVVEYSGDILRLEKEFGISIEVLGCDFAIISGENPEQIKSLYNQIEIGYMENSFILKPQVKESSDSVGLTDFKNKTGLTGKGVIIGIIDLNVDYNTPTLRDKDGNSKILYFWDQTTDGSPPNGFKKGNLYRQEDINRAIKEGTNLTKDVSNLEHGTFTSSICSEIANEANLVVVKAECMKNDPYLKSTDLIRGIKFILDKGLELKMPVVINITYCSDEGPRAPIYAFERYINEMCFYWKNNIIVAAGNEGDKGRHKFVNIKNKMEKTEVEFIISKEEKLININLWPNFADDFSVCLVSPSNIKTHPISLSSGEVKNKIGETKVKGYFYAIPPYTLVRSVTFQMSSESEVERGIWKVVISPINIVVGNIDIYIQSDESLCEQTKFLAPDVNLTLLSPGILENVITTGSFNIKTNLVSSFSGRGRIETCVDKPGVIAPGENLSVIMQNGKVEAFTGTSVASSYTTGICALILEWGIVKENDRYLYGQKMKSLFTKYARRSSNISYPNNSMGYGFLDLTNFDINSLLQINQEQPFLNRNTRVKKRIKREINRADLSSNPISSFSGLEPLIGVFHKSGFIDDINNLDIDYKYYPVSENMTIIFQNINQRLSVIPILALESVIRIEENARMAPLGQVREGTFNGVVATEEIGANFFKNNPNMLITGKDVMIGIVDSGIDYLHQDFIYPDGTSKIIALWDQTKKGNPPDGYFIGTEYTREDINRAIANNDPSLSTDEDGHGTMISGICAGLGNINKEYAGVAEDAELVVVKLEKINGYYNNLLLTVAWNYLYDKVFLLNKPMSINVTLGSNFAIGLNARISRREDFNTYFKRGVSLVAGAGNEGNTRTHTSGVIQNKGDMADIDLVLSEDEDELIIQLLVNKPDKIMVGLVTPTGELSKNIEVSNYSDVTGLFDFERTNYSIRYIYPTSYSGQQETWITLKNVKRGTWKIRLWGQYISNGIYNVFLTNRVFLKEGTSFVESNPNFTINYPADHNEVISVGAYDTRSGGLWQTSSRGPTIFGTQAPDIVAPGVNIISTYPGNKYGTITGTAAAAAYTTGSIALYLQYTLSEKNYPKKAFSQQIRTYLKAGATRNQNIEYPNYDYGYGLLNIKGTFDQFK